MSGWVAGWLRYTVHISSPLSSLLSAPNQNEKHVRVADVVGWGWGWGWGWRMEDGDGGWGDGGEREGLDG